MNELNASEMQAPACTPSAQRIERWVVAVATNLIHNIERPALLADTQSSPNPIAMKRAYQPKGRGKGFVPEISSSSDALRTRNLRQSSLSTAPEDHGLARGASLITNITKKFL